MGQQSLGFSRVLYDALLLLGYDGDALIYCCRISMANGMDVCVVSVMIPMDPMELRSWFIIGSEPNTTIHMMAQAALTYLSESRLTTTAALLIALLPIWNQENLRWQQCPRAVSTLEGPHFHTGMTSLGKYA
jgi:hypothetical protein